MAAILVSQNYETAAMLVFQTNPSGVEVFSYANTLFCSDEYAQMLATWVKTLCTTVSVLFQTWFNQSLPAIRCILGFVKVASSGGVT